MSIIGRRQIIHQKQQNYVGFIKTAIKKGMEGVIK
jgi:hypothetical protein